MSIKTGFRANCDYSMHWGVVSSNLSSIFCSPQSHMRSKMFSKDCPFLVMLYSTWGGTSGYTVRLIRPSVSNSRSWLVSVRCDNCVMLCSRELNLWGLCWIKLSKIRGLHFPPLSFLKWLPFHRWLVFFPYLNGSSLMVNFFHFLKILCVLVEQIRAIYYIWCCWSPELSGSGSKMAPGIQLWNAAVLLGRIWTGGRAAPYRKPYAGCAFIAAAWCAGQGASAVLAHRMCRLAYAIW